MGVLPGIGGMLMAGPPEPGLKYRGHGYVKGASSTAHLPLTYSTVVGGASPVAGNLVIWIAESFDNNPPHSLHSDLSPQGWAHSRAVARFVVASLLAKVVTASDLSAPPSIVSQPTHGSAGMWVAYEVTGSISTIRASPLNHAYNVASPAEDISIDSTGEPSDDFVLTAYGGFLNHPDLDYTPDVSWSGATPDISLPVVGIPASNFQARFASHLGRGGRLVTASGGYAREHHLGYLALTLS